MIETWQVILLSLYAFYQILDDLTIVSSAGSPVFAGFISGLIMGDVTTGLYIGGSLQLVILGVGTFGGASRIDANSGTVLATAFAIGYNMDPEVAIAAIAVPVASLLVQFDILARFSNTFFVHRIDKNIQKHEYNKMTINYLLGALPWGLSRALPIFLALQFGGDYVNQIVEFINHHMAWLSTGLATAGALLPAVGFAILLRYLPAKRHFAYLILGFILTAILSTLYSNVATIGGQVATLSATAKLDFSGSFGSLPMLAIALVGVSLAMIEYKKSLAITVQEQHINEGDEIDGDEI